MPTLMTLVMNRKTGGMHVIVGGRPRNRTISVAAVVGPLQDLANAADAVSSTTRTYEDVLHIHWPGNFILSRHKWSSYKIMD